MCTLVCGIGGADCKKCARFQKIANVGHASVDHCWQTVLVWHMLANSSFFFYGFDGLLVCDGNVKRLIGGESLTGFANLMDGNGKTT